MISFLGFDSTKIRDTFSKDLASLRKEIDSTVRSVRLAHAQAAQAEYDRSSFEHQINFANASSVMDQNHVSAYKKELEQSRAKLDALGNQVNNKKLEIEQRKTEMKQQLDQVQALNKKLDNELMARIAVETELETYREELLFLKSVYEEEYNELGALGTFQVDVSQFYQTELANAIASIRKDYELLAQTQYKEWQGNIV